MGHVKKFYWVIVLMIPSMLCAQSGFCGKSESAFISVVGTLNLTIYTFLPAAQFLKIKEDRSYAGELKSELLIRIGESLCTQLQSLSGADTVYFVNADLSKGSTFKKDITLLRTDLKILWQFPIQTLFS